jgi:NADH:ubiquinone oxidoreductase subunit 6 (subunit J)
VNSITFYLLAALVVAGSGAVVVVPRLRDAAFALAATAVVIAILSAAVGADAVAVAEFVIVVGSGVATWAVLRRGSSYRGLARTGRWLPRRWWLAAAVAAFLGLLLLVVFAVSSDAWHIGSGTASLVSVLHYRAVYAFMLAVVLVVAGVGAALLLGRVSHDERETDRAVESRRQREERERRRREDREAARRRRGGSTRAGERDT